MIYFLQRFRYHVFNFIFPVGCPWITPITSVLIVATVLVSVCSRFGKDMAWVQALSMTQFQFVEGTVAWKSGLPEVRHGEVWRLVSPFLLHFSVSHMASNCFGLWVFGTQFEWKHGPVRFLAFLVSAELVCNLVLYEFRGPYFGGLSGPGLAVFGYLLWRAKVQPAPGFKLDWIVCVLVLIEHPLSAMGIGPHTSLIAHITGLLFGFFVAWLVTPARRVQPLA